MSDNASSFVAFFFGLLTGAVIGAATALLLAPMSGLEMRQQLATQAQSEYERAKLEYQRQTAKLHKQSDELDELIAEAESAQV